MRRIVVNGYGLLERWAEIAPGKPRHADIAKEELIYRLTQYFDSCETPLTVLFEEEMPRNDPGPFLSTPEVEILFRPARGADRLLERMVSRLKASGEVLVVTDVPAERTAVQSVGGKVADCSTFIHMVEDALNVFKQHLTKYNQTEQLKFQTH